MQHFPISFVFSMVSGSLVALVTVPPSPSAQNERLGFPAQDKRGLMYFGLHHKEEGACLWAWKVMSFHVYRAVAISSPSFHTG